MKAQIYIRILIALGICILINVVSSYYHGFIDLTEEKRFTLSPATESMLEDLDEVIYVQILLDGTLPGEIERLKTSTLQLMDDFNDINSNIEYEVFDPNVGDIKSINARRTELAKDKIVPQEIQIVESGEQTKKLIYPYAVVKLANRKRVVRLIKSAPMSTPVEVQVNESIQLLEFKIASAINDLIVNKKEIIVFIDGHGELPEQKTARLEGELKQKYFTKRVKLDSLVTIPDEIALLIVAKPESSFSDKDLFKIDQYIMGGGNILWMIDKLDVTLQDINEAKFYIPPIHDLNLDDIFFKYGIRMQPDLVLDLECTQIPQVVGRQGDKVQTDLFPWYYHPLVAGKSNHPIVKNVERVNMKFASSIDTLQPRKNNPLALNKEVLLSTSEYTRYQITPVRLNFEILKYPPKPEQFNKGSLPVAVLVEGPFESFYKNRVGEGMLNTLKDIGIEYKESSVGSKQIFISDGDVAKNNYDPETNRLSPLGYNPWVKKTFDGNRSFILNCIEYLTDNTGLMDARSKEIKLRPLNKIKVQSEKTYWQFINIAMPLIIILLFGIIYNLLRKRRYSKQ